MLLVLVVTRPQTTSSSRASEPSRTVRPRGQSASSSGQHSPHTPTAGPDTTSQQRALTHTRRERASIASERASFDHEVRRREAAFRSYENEARRRATERESRPRQQRRASVVPPPLASQAAIAVFAAFEAAFERFEADVDGSELPMASLPWPPEDVPVSGVRRSDSDAARKARLKKALLRWHPDKYVAAHASRISASELAAVVERVTAVMQRVQQERVAYGSAPV